MENDADVAVPSERSLQPRPLRLRSEPALNAVEGVNSVEEEESGPLAVPSTPLGTGLRPPFCLRQRTEDSNPSSVFRSSSVNPCKSASKKT
jgi:hypothetical protein